MDFCSKQTFLLLAIFWICCNGQGSNLPLETLKQWTIFSYDFPWEWPQTDMKFYNPESIVATGIAIGIDRIYLSTPRLFSGVPSTLSVISRNEINDSPVLQAYPDWSHHAAGQRQYNCSDIGLVSVYRTRIDSCNRLWVLDSGVSRSLEDFEVTCPPKILIYDLVTDQVLRRIDFPAEVVRGESLFTNLVLDETTSRPENHCDDIFAYITDTVAPGLIVYDSGNDLTWRFTHPSMYPDPNFSESTIQTYRFTLMDGVVGIALDAKASIVYFQPLATDRLFSIETSALRNGPLPFGQDLPVKLVGRKSSQGIGLAVSPADGSIFFSPFTETAIAQWNPHTNEQKVLAVDEEKIQFAADLRAPSRDPGFIYILTSRFHRFFLKNVDSNDFNTRILRIYVGGSQFISPAKPQHHFLDGNLGYKLAQMPPPFHKLPTSTFYTQNNNIPQAEPLKSRLYLPPNFLNKQLNVVSPLHHQQQQVPSFVYPSMQIPNQGSHNSIATIFNSREAPATTTQFFGSLPQSGYTQITDNNNQFFYQKINRNFNEFNGLRNAKSVTYNSTVLHQ